jgi:vanillate O-demethylase monooxygenase subunit
VHPLNQAEPYPSREWWIAAYADEVGRQILGRTILGQPLILFRTEAGEAAALSGVCPHRSYPLALATLAGDTVQCPYHGFTFAASGACVRVPSQSSIPARSELRLYPCVERGGLVWVWTGVEGADPDLIPPIEAMGLGRADWVADLSPMVTIEGRYTLLIDNLLDLSHASFIHADTIPGGGAIAAIPAEIVETPSSLNVRRVGRGLPANPLLRRQFPGHDGAVDQHFDAEYYGPNLIRTGGAIYPAGSEIPLGTQNFIHGITPAGPHKVHYFVVTTRDFGLDDPELSAINLAMGDRIQPQDIRAIEAIERNLQSLPAPPSEASCRVDTGALKVRHRLAAQIAAEQTPSTA